MATLTPGVSKKDHIQGPADAPVTLVEYGDYQCEHCGAAYPWLKELLSIAGDDVRFVFRNFPLAQSHPLAVPAAIAAEAAARQGKFWEMHDMIFEHQSRLSIEALHAFAIGLGLDRSAFQQDIEDVTLEGIVNHDFESGIRSGVNGTPSFFINGKKYEGDHDLSSLLAAVQAAIPAS